MIADPPRSEKVINDFNKVMGEFWYSWFAELKNQINYVSSTRVNKNGVNQNITANTTTKVTWAKEEKDTQGEFDLTNNKWTAKKAGDYYVSVGIGIEIAADQDRIDLEIYKNGSSIRYRRISASGSNDMDIGFSDIIEDISVDDYLEVYINNKDNNDTINGDTKRTYLAIRRLGDS